MEPVIVIVGSARSVQVQADLAGFVRAHLLQHGVPCGPLGPLQDLCRSFPLGRTANLGLVQALLDRWAAPGA
jgi:hypothetical protein